LLFKGDTSLSKSFGLIDRFSVDIDITVFRTDLGEGLNRLIDQPGGRRIAQRFAAHLAIESPAVFTFLLDPAIDATNWRAEQALRPAVVTRKVCGGNRTTHGAHTHEVLASVLRTIQERQLNASVVFSDPLRSPKPFTALATSPRHL
jgi:transposase